MRARVSRDGQHPKPWTAHLTFAGFTVEIVDFGSHADALAYVTTGVAPTPQETR